MTKVSYKSLSLTDHSDAAQPGTWCQKWDLTTDDCWECRGETAAAVRKPPLSSSPMTATPVCRGSSVCARWWWIRCNTIKGRRNTEVVPRRWSYGVHGNSAEIPIDFCPAPAESSSASRPHVLWRQPRSSSSQGEDWGPTYLKNLPFHLMAAPGLSFSHLVAWLDEPAQFKPAVI